MPQDKTKIGIGLGLLAAVCYGFIPLFTKPLQDATGAAPMYPSTILLYRFGIAALVVGAIMLLRGISFRISYTEFLRLSFLALLSDGAAVFLIAGYPYMNSGVATTIHFMYPVMTAILMMTFFNEPRRLSTLLAVLMAVAGVGVLSWSDSGHVQTIGIVLELISALCFALYLIRVNHSSHLVRMDVLKLTFYVMAIGALIFAAFIVYQHSVFPEGVVFTLVPQGNDWLLLLALALVCTVVTNLSLVYAAKYVGPTVASVLGALEPLTAILIGSLFLGEALTPTILIGIGLILPAVLIIVLRAKRNDA